MDKNTLGKIIEYERKRKRILQQKLAEGVCTNSTLYRLEKGERFPSFFVIERLLGRLGRSVNKIEFLCNEEDYEIYYLRELIERLLEKKEILEVREALFYYESLPVSRESLHRQYIYKIQSIIFKEEGAHIKAAEFLKLALEETIPNLRLSHLEQPSFVVRELEKYVLGEEELVLLLMWIREMAEQNPDALYLEGRQLLNYIDQICEDEEVKANVYSKTAWVLGTWTIKKEALKEAYEYTLEGERVLVENGLLLHLPQFLDRILLLSKKLDKNEYLEWKMQRDALKSLYEQYNETWETKEPQLWKNYRQQEVYLVSELFEQERKLNKKSQGKLAHETEIDIKTISRIESGKFKPKPGTFRKLKEYLQIDRDICTTRIVVDDFSLLELERDIAKLNSHRREREAEKLYNCLKRRLSPKWKENQQFIIYMDMLFAHQLGRMKTDEAMEECIRAFQITRPNIMLDEIDKIVLSRMETFIINYICKCYDEKGRKEDTITLLKKAVEGYTKSKVDTKYHYAPLSLLYEHLAINCEETDRLEEAVKWCDIAIKFDFKCKRGDNLGYIWEQKIYTLDRIKGDRTCSKDKYLQVYQILKMMKQEKDMEALRKVYFEWYSKEIEVLL